MTITRTHEAQLRIAADHPALAGHFPDRPVIPGVVLLDCVLEAAEDWIGRPVEVATLVQAKFLAPLPPETDARIDLQREGTSLRFRVSHGESLLAQGSFIVAAEDQA